MASRIDKIMELVRSKPVQINSADKDKLEFLSVPAYESTKGLGKDEREAAIKHYKSLPSEHAESIKDDENKNTAQSSYLNVTRSKLVDYSSSEGDTDTELTDNKEFHSDCDTQTKLSKNLKKHLLPISDSDSFSDKGSLSDEYDYHLPEEHSSNDESNTVTKCKETEKTSFPSTSQNLVVAVNSNTKDCRVWDLKSACLYCGKLVSKLPEHIQLIHSEEKEVVTIMEKKKGSKEKKLLITNLRNKGNFLHNQSVLREGKGLLLVRRRPRSACEASEFLPCEYCLGFYKRTKLTRHIKKCDMNSKNNEGRSSGEVRSAVFLNPPLNSNDKLKQILSRMTNDEISLVVRNDNLIIKYGTKLSDKYEGQDHLSNYISQKMRELARLVLCARKYEDINLSKLIDPSKFSLIVSCTREITNLNNSGQECSRPSLALKIGYSLKKCCKIIKGEGIVEGNETKRKRAEDFMALYELEWSEKILQRATKMLDRAKWNRPSLLPIADDIKKFNLFVQKREEELYEKLCGSDATEQDFKELTIVTLAHLISFNRKRVGDVEKLEKKTYLERPQIKHQGEIEATLTNCEKILTKTMTLLTIRGKHDRGVPLLLTPTMVRNIDLLILKRSVFSVPHGNQFIFARPGCDSHIRGTDALRMVATKCGAVDPKNITSTRLRKHIATVSQILNLSSNELEHLAKHLGHSTNVHREYYRLPDTTIQLAKVSKLLLQFENGHLKEGTSLDDIDLDLDDSTLEKETDEGKLEHDSSNNEDVTDTSTTEDEEKSPKMNENRRKTKISIKTRNGSKRSSNRILWDETETKAIEKFFEKDILREIVPGKKRCEECIQKYPCLTSRSWVVVKSKVHNIIKTNKKRKQM